jgi:hypothetical protein
MVNNWIKHVKKYAEENNISYACAISNPDCKKNYNKVEKPKKLKTRFNKKELELKNKMWGDEFIKQHPKLINKMDEEQFNKYKRQFNMSGIDFKNYIKNNAPEIYKLLLIPKSTP